MGAGWDRFVRRVVGDQLRERTALFILSFSFLPYSFSLHSLSLRSLHLIPFSRPSPCALDHVCHDVNKREAGNGRERDTRTKTLATKKRERERGGWMHARG